MKTSEPSYQKKKERDTKRRTRIRLLQNSIDTYELSITTCLDPARLPELLRTLRSLKLELYHVKNNTNDSKAFAFYPCKRPSRKQRREKKKNLVLNLTPKKKKRK